MWKMTRTSSDTTNPRREPEQAIANGAPGTVVGNNTLDHKLSGFFHGTWWPNHMFAVAVLFSLLMPAGSVCVHCKDCIPGCAGGTARL